MTTLHDTSLATRTTERVAVERPRVDLSRYDCQRFDRGASRAKELAWLVVRRLFFQSPLCTGSLRAWWLRRFGASVGRHVVIRSGVRIKFPWRLRVGDHVWIGEDVELLNLAPIAIASHVCISQRAFLCTGNHDYRRSDFVLRTGSIRVETGAWIGAAAFVAPGVTVGSHAVLTAASVATRSLAPYTIYQGYPARAVRERILEDQHQETSPHDRACESSF